jgi:hypothetical protein
MEREPLRPCQLHSLSHSPSSPIGFAPTFTPQFKLTAFSSSAQALTVSLMSVTSQGESFVLSPMGQLAADLVSLALKYGLTYKDWDISLQFYLINWLQGWIYVSGMFSKIA